MRTRVTTWLDQKTLKPAHGFQVFHNGQWLNAAENGRPCIYATEKERDAKRKEFRKMAPNASHEGPGAASSRTVPLDAVVGRHPTEDTK